MDSLTGYVATGIVMLAVGLLLRYFEPKSSVVYWSPQHFIFQLTDLTLLTHAITIQNLGRKLAKNIEIVHKAKPDFFKLDPSLDYKEFSTPAGEHVVKIENLGPKEFFTIQFLSYATLPQLLYIRSEEGQCELIQIQPQRVYPQWFNFLVVTFMFIGLGFTVYWVIRAIIFISSNIGIA